MAGFLDEFKRGFADARADTAKPRWRESAPEHAGEAFGAEADVSGGDAGSAKPDQEALAEVTALAEQYETRIKELESELAGSAVLGEVLLLPGVKRWLAGRYHPDKPGLNDGERKAFTEAMQKINTAYDALEKKDEE
jgi:hypothetical protein